MKTTIEMHGFEIVIEETEEGILTVSASKEGEVVEEFTLEAGEEGQSEDGEEIKGFEEFGDDEEEDFDDEDVSDEEPSDEDLESDEDMGAEEEEDAEDDNDEEEEEEEEDEAQLESFQSFINSSKEKVATKKVAPKKRK